MVLVGGCKVKIHSLKIGPSCYDFIQLGSYQAALCNHCRICASSIGWLQSKWDWSSSSKAIKIRFVIMTDSFIEGLLIFLQSFPYLEWLKAKKFYANAIMFDTLLIPFSDFVFLARKRLKLRNCKSSNSTPYWCNF